MNTQAQDKATAIVRNINDQEFSIVNISGTGITSYPTENLTGLSADWKLVTVEEIAALVAVAEAAEEILRELEDFIFSAITNQKGFQNSDLFYRATDRAKKQQKALAKLAAVREGGAK